MAVFAVGDIQGCYKEFRALLDTIRFDRKRDLLWLTGDLVNRGPDSLAVLRFVRDLGDSAVTVLGNHDLHLLAVACGVRSSGSHDTLDETLAAPDAPELLKWLRQRPLLYRSREIGWSMIHAGLPPQWDLETAEHRAREVESALRADDYVALLKKLFKKQSKRQKDRSGKNARLRFATNCLTRLRYCDENGNPRLAHSGAPGTQPEGQVPWFEVPDRRSRGSRIVFGHWSTLGAKIFADLKGGAVASKNLRAYPDVLPLDGGCVWGGKLVAARIDSELVLHHSDCVRHQQPGA